MKHKDALFVAEWLMGELRESCERIEIAGSIRRGKPDVKDIEIVAIPILKPPCPEFGKPIDKTPLDRQLRWLEDDGMLKRVKGGDKFKQFEIRRLVEFGIAEPLTPLKLDLFLVTPPSQWGVEFMIRTGPSDFSKWMVTQKSKGGALPDGVFVRHNVVWSDGLPVYVGGRLAGTDVPKKVKDAIKIMNDLNHIEMPEEQDFFSYCSLPWIEPSKRVARWR